MRAEPTSLYAPSLLCLALGATALLAGCGVTSGKSSAPMPAALRGSVHGGQHPVTGASIQLYAAGAGGYGSAASPLLSPAASTDLAGNFSITGLYTCPSADAQVYLVATGGNPGLGTGTNNAALALMAALGPCGNLKSSTLVNINEVTTVASVYSLAQFMAVGGGANLGASNTNSQGLANAFATVNNLVNIATGGAPGSSLPIGATVPTTELNTLADILAICVNSDGSSGECSGLFAAATPAGGDAPTNTIDAILDIAQNPGNNVGALYNLLVGTPPFQPILGSAPNDWTVMMNYVGGGMDFPLGLAIDGLGNVWIGNLGSGPASSLSKFSPTGSALSPSTGFTGGGLVGKWAAIAIDSSENVWATNGPTSSLSEFSNAGSPLSPSTGYTGGGLDVPSGIAIDGSDNIWASNYGYGLSKFSNDGTALSPLGGYTGGGLNQTNWDIAIDGSGNVWAGGNEAPQCLSEFSNDGVALSPSSGYTGGGLSEPVDIAVDGSGNIWVANLLLPIVSKFSPDGVALSPPAGYTGGGQASTRFLAVDGAGNVWLANDGYEVSELSNNGTPISPSTGYIGGGLFVSAGIGVDGSGNVWVANENSSTLTEIVGAAAPVVTPLAVGVKNNKLGQRP